MGAAPRLAVRRTLKEWIGGDGGTSADFPCEGCWWVGAGATVGIAGLGREGSGGWVVPATSTDQDLQEGGGNHSPQREAVAAVHDVVCGEQGDGKAMTSAKQSRPCPSDRPSLGFP